MAAQWKPDARGQVLLVLDLVCNVRTRIPTHLNLRKPEVQLGRRNNNFIEVLDGLKPGERVITSTYSGLVDKDHLSFDTDE